MSRRMAVDIGTFSMTLRYWRLVHGWTEEELARRATITLRRSGATERMTAAWIRVMEQRAAAVLGTISVQRLMALADALEVSVDTLAPEAARALGWQTRDAARDPGP
ncbi:MAG: helix-turn-helix domain-containing protein [Sulfobacillus thermotolerans]|nr:helix-turn-helix domain-containing protein [Sulfobacillus thermotolerans]